jgi:FkbM family methyltransferase
MLTASQVRHSFVGRGVRRMIHFIYQMQHPAGKPVEYHLPGGVVLQLYPEGEVAEFLAFPRLFERTELELVRACLQPGMQVIDVGSNIGLYSILADKLVGEEGKVWAIEPSGETAERLQRNLSLNGCNRVQLTQTALSDETDTFLTLKSDNGFGDAYRYLLPSKGAVAPDGGQTELVPVTTLDRWAAENGVTKVDFLKVDIEGGEFRMFRGAQEVLKANKDILILFENEADWCRRAGCTQQDTFDLLRSLGFEIFTWDTRTKQWTADPTSLLKAGMIWACTDQQKLPQLRKDNS